MLSLHAPLGFLDYDGPSGSTGHFLQILKDNTKILAQEVARKAYNYKVVNWNIFPGSLGNFYGFERNLPTITIELETTDPMKTDIYWRKFLPGFIEAIQFKFPAHASNLIKP